MNDDRRSPLEMRWVPVTDEHGRTRMETLWILTDEPIDAIHAA